MNIKNILSVWAFVFLMCSAQQGTASSSSSCSLPICALNTLGIDGKKVPIKAVSPYPYGKKVLLPFMSPRSAFDNFCAYYGAYHKDFSILEALPTLDQAYNACRGKKINYENKFKCSYGCEHFHRLKWANPEHPCNKTPEEKLEARERKRQAKARKRKIVIAIKLHCEYAPKTATNIPQTNLSQALAPIAEEKEENAKN